jgi:hypothetical protein
VLNTVTETLQDAAESLSLGYHSNISAVQRAVFDDTGCQGQNCTVHLDLQKSRALPMIVFSPEQRLSSTKVDIYRHVFGVLYKFFRGDS